MNVGVISTEFTSVIDMLTGVDTKASKVAAGPELGSASVAAFSDGEGEAIGLIVADTAFLLSVGAALSLMPADEVTNALDSGVIPDEIWENYHEVANVLSRVFGSVSDRSVMDRCEKPGEADQVAVTSFRQEHGALHLKVDVPGYPGGLVSLFCDEAEAESAPRPQLNSGAPGVAPQPNSPIVPVASAAEAPSGAAPIAAVASPSSTDSPTTAPPRSHLGRGGLRPYGATPKWKRK